MKIILIASALRHSVRSGNQHFAGWGGSMEACIAALSCIIRPQTIVYPICRIGAADMEEYTEYISTRYGKSFSPSGLIPDPLGTNFHQAIFDHESSQENVKILRKVAPVEYSDLEEFLPGTDLIILNAGDIDSYNANIIEKIRFCYPEIMMFIDVHRKINIVDEHGIIRKNGWKNWQNYLPLADAVQMNKSECAALLELNKVVESSVNELLISGIKCTIITLGSEGLLIGARQYVRKLRAAGGPAIDASGAGDTLGVGFSVFLTRGYTISESAMLGSALASFTCEKVGYLLPGDVNEKMLIQRVKNEYDCIIN